MSKLSDETKRYIINQIESIEYGKVIIEVNGTADCVYVVVEERKRFNKENHKKYAVKSKLHKG